MATPTPPLIRWKHAAWREMPTAAQQLEELRRHLSEVAGFALESAGGRGRSLKLSPEYLPMLERELAQLERQAAFTRMPARGVSAYQRGSGP